MATLTTVQQVQAVYKSILRTDLNESAAQAVADAIDSGTSSLSTYQAGLIAQVTNTTQAAFALSTFIEGIVPTSARIDSLTTFAQTQYDYYANVLKSGNAQLGAYEALGKAFAADASTSASFAARYGSLSTTDFVTTVYAQIFDAAGKSIPNEVALANLVSQVEYFTGIYVAAGVPAADAALQAKGAVLGQIIGYAFTDATRAGDSSLQSSITSAIATAATDAASGNPTEVYGKAILAADITITGDVGPAVATPALKSTVYNDTIKGTLGTPDFVPGTKIDGGLGIDSLTVTTAIGNIAYNPAADIVKSIEKVTVVSAVASTADVTNIKGMTDFTLGAASAASLAVTGLDSSTTVHVAATDAAATLTLGYATAPAAAKVSIDANYAGTISFSDSAVKSVTADVTVANSGVNFADSDLESVTVTSKGGVSISDIGTGLKTLDLSGVGTFSVTDLTNEGFANAVTVTLGKGADELAMTANKAHSITLGAGADTLKVAAGGNVVVTDAAALAASATIVTDFSKSDLDILKFYGLRTELDSTQSGQISGSADLLAAASLAATFADAGKWVVFNFGSDAYILNDAGDAGLDVADTLVKVAGAQVNDFNSSNLVFVDLI